MRLRQLFRVSFVAGLLGGLAMMPLGALFMAHGLRINEYGQRIIALLFSSSPQPIQFILFVLLHFVISWLAAVPLVWMLLNQVSRKRNALVGAVYGILFYIAINSLLLPIIFGDPTPWSLGLATVVPSLTVHLVYGLVVAFGQSFDRKIDR